MFRSFPSWDVAQCMLVVGYQCFRKMHQSHLHTSSILHYLTLEDRTNYHQPRPHNIREEQRPQLHHGRSKKSHIFMLLYSHLQNNIFICISLLWVWTQIQLLSFEIWLHRKQWVPIKHETDFKPGMPHSSTHVGRSELRDEVGLQKLNIKRYKE